MASPFTVFRRHQKVLLATLGLAAMISFVFLGSIQQIIGERSTANPVVVRSKFGKLTEYDLRNMRQLRTQVLGVLIEARTAAGIPTRPIEAPTEEEMVNVWLMARQAEQMGIVITNGAINAQLRDMTNDRVKPADWQAIFRRHGFSDRSFFQAYRDEMLAMGLNTLFRPAAAATTPAQRWDYFLRLNRLATIEAVPISVDRFVSQIADPDEAALEGFFDQYKTRLPDPGSPEPGFREPHRIDVQYFKAELDKFTPLVTDQEIKDEYEKNQKKYDQQEEDLKKADRALEGEKPAPPTKAPETEKPAAERPSAEPSDTAPPSEPPAAAKPAGESPAAEKPAADKPADNAPASEKPAAEKPAAETPPPAKPAAPEPAKKTGALQRDGRTSASFVSLVSDSSDQPSTDEKGAPASEPKQPAAEPKQSEPPADAKKSGEAGAPPEAAAPEGKQEPKAAEGKAGETAMQPVERPSTRIKERIRRELAQRKTVADFEELKKVVLSYGIDVNRYEGEQAANVNAKAPTPPDFKALAAEHHMTVDRTGLVSEVGARGLPIGRSYMADGQTPFLKAAFEKFTVYIPNVSFDGSGNLYLFWKTDDRKERVPKLEDLRNSVVKAWKQIEARKPAMAEAEKLATEARKAGSSLQDAFRGRADLHVAMSAPFSWWTLGNVFSQVPLRISPVEGVEMPGDDFMRTVFSLKPEQVGAAMNQPQNVAYVIRLVDYSKSEKSLWETFISENAVWSTFGMNPYNRYAPVAREEEQSLRRAWLDEIKSSAGLKWERRADQPVEAPASSAPSSEPDVPLPESF